MSRFRYVKALCGLVVFTAIPRYQEPGPLRGFSAAGSRAEREWEAKLRNIPSTDSMRSYLKRLSARPQHLGSAYGRDNVDWLVRLFTSWGLDAKIETFDVLFPTPKERVLELIAPNRYVAKLREPPVPGDQSSTQQSEQLPTYHAYSTDGDVTGPLVFVNYGVPADYEQLDRLGISVKGAIVIAKYGGSWRGIKPKVAAEHGAIGCLIYSDPADDGFGPGDVYPKGPYRPADGVQRGSVADMPLYSGDPATPGVGATKAAKRLPLAEIQTITKIPVLPISYGDAQPLLAALGGPIAPAQWRGGLPLTYKVGPGPARVHLKLAFNWNTVPANDVIVRIPGTDAADQWVVRGNHRDGWVNGAQDPLSGLIAEMEELRGLATLLKQGWKPRRTIIYAAWDGEEQGLLGSTEWVETHARELQDHVVAYINSDVNARGFFEAGGSHTLERFVNDVVRDIDDPESGMSVWKRRRLANLSSARSARERSEIRNRPDLRISALGSGSDFTPFLQYAGIASLNIGFGGEDGNGIYHSIYDNFEHFTRFNDSSYVYGKALAQTSATMVMRLAQADVLPYHFVAFAETIGQYLDQLKELWTTRRDEITERNREIDEGVFRATNDPTRPLAAPARQAVPPSLNFAPLENAVAALRESAERYEAALAKADLSAGNRADLNQILLKAEHLLTSPDGLPRRTWYKHQIYAPGFYTGYGVKTIPGVREAIEQGYWKEAEENVTKVADRLSAFGAEVDRAAGMLK
ncbi:MAG: transferrin receptor-like dimerization domain-containing protein [Gemmatimonadota bacterium]